MSTRIGIVGFGEAGQALGLGLVGAGASVCSFDVRASGPDGPELAARARQGGVELVDDPASLAARCEVVLSMVTAPAALSVAEDLAAHVGPTHLVADLNSTAPALAVRIGETFAPSGAAFADVAVMAAVPAHAHRVPMLASGPGAIRLAGLGLELDVEVVGEEPGTASGIKLLRSLVVKGLEALLLEFAVSARRLDATDRVLASLDGALPTGDFSELTTYLLSRTARHARRRGHELEQAAGMLRELEVEPMVTEAAARRLLWAADQGLPEAVGDLVPTHYDDVLDALEEGRP